MKKQESRQGSRQGSNRDARYLVLTLSQPSGDSFREYVRADDAASKAEAAKLLARHAARGCELRSLQTLTREEWMNARLGERVGDYMENEAARQQLGYDFCEGRVSAPAYFDEVRDRESLKWTYLKEVYMMCRRMLREGVPVYSADARALYNSLCRAGDDLIPDPAQRDFRPEGSEDPFPDPYGEELAD